jgi:H+/gluconate symporter-like permease
MRPRPWRGLLGALFGKLMDDSGCVSAIAGFMTERLVSAAPCWRSY